MHHPFLPLILVILAAAYLGGRLGLLARPACRWALAAAAVVVVGLSIAAGGVDFAYLKRMKLLLAAATAVLLLLRSRHLAGLDRNGRYRAVLVALAALAWILHFNFLAFHGSASTRTFVHLHDMAHYYLGSKYFPELGHADLYTGMLRAEAERYGGRFTRRQARDLRSNELVDVSELLRDSAPVKGRFSPRRWAEFQDDVTYFRDAIGPQYDAVLRDHGYNPSPLWTRIGGALANLVPAGSGRGIALLAALDPLLEIGIFVAIAWAFGIEAALLSMIYFCLLFGASFGWLGGAFLRYLWLFAVVVAACALGRRRFVTAGGFLAFATVLRIFPLAFAAGIACKAVASSVRWRPPRRYVQLLAAFAATGLLLFAWSATGPRGMAETGSRSATTCSGIWDTARSTPSG